jgi:hypothetical protein
MQRNRVLAALGKMLVDAVFLAILTLVASAQTSIFQIVPTPNQNEPRQQNLWVVSGSGSRPSV